MRQSIVLKKKKQLPRVLKSAVELVNQVGNSGKMMSNVITLLMSNKYWNAFLSNLLNIASQRDVFFF